MPTTDANILKHLDEVGPYTLAELVPPFDSGRFGVCRNTSPMVAARVVNAMPGRFTFEQAFDFCDYHACDDYDNMDLALAALLKKTDCTADERDQLLLAFGSDRIHELMRCRDEAQAAAAAHTPGSTSPAAAGATPDAAADAPSAGEIAAGALAGYAVYNAVCNRRKRAQEDRAGELAFQDFNNAWGSNNDHNWDADGDTQWDNHNN